MSLKIVQFNEPILRKKGSKITAFNATLRKLADAMIETMHDAEGIGLAAQQIGQAIQLCVVDLRPVESKFGWEYDGTRPPLELFMPLALVNPEIVRSSRQMMTLWDDCFSFPDLAVKLKRHLSVEVRYRDPEGKEHRLKTRGALSELLQHEIDHVNGILALDRAVDSKHIVYKSEIEKLKLVTARKEM